jgi:hypothetical protein
MARPTGSRDRPDGTDRLHQQHPAACDNADVPRASTLTRGYNRLRFTPRVLPVGVRFGPQQALSFQVRSTFSSIPRPKITEDSGWVGRVVGLEPTTDGLRV